jgi:sRNA-binding protein
MSYRYNRQEIESAIELLPELYPKCFFLDPGQRRPLKHNIVAELMKDGVQLTPELLRAAIDWYQSHFGYQLALQAGVKRIDLNGKEVGTVTQQEHRDAQKYVHDRKQEERERKQQEREKQNANLIVERIAKPAESNLPIVKLPMLNANINVAKETTMPVKAVKPSDPLAPIQTLLDAVRTAFEQPEPLQRPFAVAGLRVVIAEIEKTIHHMEKTDGQASCHPD